MRRLSPWALALCVGIAGCSDQWASPSGPPPILDPSAVHEPSGTLDYNIELLSAQLFPAGLETAAGTRWKNVKEKYHAGQTDPSQRAVAAKLLVELSKWVMAKVPQMEPPPGDERPQSAATRLVSYMAMYVHVGPTAEIPAYSPQADATVGFVSPTSKATITTPSSFAGVGVEIGSVSSDAIITIIQNPQPYPETCSGPLDTNLCQYPLFYEFDVYPKQKFLKEVHVAVCHIDATHTRRPLDPPSADDHGTVHDRMRLAHPSEVIDPTSDENIDILELTTDPLAVTSGVDCEPDATPTTALGRAVAGVFAALGRVLSPAPLYAVDQGPEHDTPFFSPINYVDPESRPDLAVTITSVSGLPATTPPAAYAGESMTIDYVVTNRSPVHGGNATATSKATGHTVYFVGADGSEVLVGPSAALPGMLPDAPAIQVSRAVTLPAGAGAGAAELVVRITPPPGLADGVPGNDEARSAITVRVPVVTSVSVSPATAIIDVGGSQQFTATVRDERGRLMTDRAVTWQSGNGLLATVDAAGLATGLASGTVPISATADGVSGSGTLTINNLCSLDNLETFGTASAVPPPGCALRLTSAGPSQSGGAWSKTKLKVNQGFTTTFRFRFTNAGGACDSPSTCGADGIAFVIQNQAGNAVGGLGGGIGYQGLVSSVAVELDTWFNSGCDINSNHVAVHTNGLQANSACSGNRGSQSVPFEMNSGQEHSVTIVYQPGMLKVYFDGATSPTLSVAIDLASIGGSSILDAQGMAWVGFTGATGAAWANQDILSWSFSSSSAVALH